MPPAEEIIDHAALGREMLKDMGIDPTEIGTIQLFAGGVCQGTIEEFMGMEKHAPIRDGVIEIVRSAKESGVDPAQAVVTSLGIFVKRDEQGQPLKADAEIEKKKLNSPEIEELVSRSIKPEAQKKVDESPKEPKAVETPEVAEKIIDTFERQQVMARAEIVHRSLLPNNDKQSHDPLTLKLKQTMEPMPKPLNIKNTVSPVIKNQDVNLLPIIPLAEVFAEPEIPKIETILPKPAEATETLTNTFEEPAEVLESEIIEPTELVEIQDEIESDTQTLEAVEVEINSDIVASPAVLLAELPFVLELSLPQSAVYELDTVESEEIVEPVPILSEQIAEYIQALEPAQAEEAQAILGVMMEKIQSLLEIVPETQDKQESEAIEQELEVLCTRILVCMGIEPNAKNVSRLIHSLTLEIQLQLREAQIIDEGTHEKKPYMSLLLDELSDNMKPPVLLGKYALQLATN